MNGIRFFSTTLRGSSEHRAGFKTGGGGGLGGGRLAFTILRLLRALVNMMR